jgi:cysteine-rich repeat protein
MRRIILALTLAVLSSVVRNASATTAADICAANVDPCVVSSARNVTPGSTLDFGSRQLDVKASGSLTVAGGLMTINAGSVRLESHAALRGLAAGGTSGSISVTTTGDIAVENGANGKASIDVSLTDNPGQIALVAGGNIVVSGDVRADATSSQGSGGVIDVTADGTVSVLGNVSARGGTTFGFGGSITISAASFTSGGSLRVDAGDGGDIDIESSSGSFTSTGDLNASAGGNYGDGGSLTLFASSNLTLGGTVNLSGAGSVVEGGGTGGDVDLEATTGTVSIPGAVDNHGAAPDGDGGEVDVYAGLDYTQSGDIISKGNGVDSCGGALDVAGTRLVSFLGGVDVSGGFCGGDVDAAGATVSVGSGSTLNADGGFFGGGVDLEAEAITVAGRLQVSGTASSGAGGLVGLAGCTMSVVSGASIKTDGAGGLNLLQASGLLTLGGQLSSRPSGRNRFEYRDPARPPITLGTASVQPVRDCAPGPGCLVTDLAPCAASAICGNGVRESGEDCDDGNTAACDGCSAICQSEGCGNGTIECGEECDDGPANGGPGDPCDSTCHVVTGSDMVFVPSSHRGNGCMLEWAVRSPSVAGFPPSTISCVDGDPACDADGAIDGGCTFHVTACLNVTDARIPSCAPTSVEFVNLRRPSVTDPDDAVEAANAQALASVLEGLGLTVRSRQTVLYMGTPESRTDQCTPTVSQRVPHSAGSVGRRLVSAAAGDVAGRGVSNRMVLACAPNPAVCGNGVIEIGEQCDDGNTASCDGCSDTCRMERCGDGIVQCGEQCDDGPGNGQPGSACTGACGFTPPAGRIPGGRSSGACLTEWALDTDALAESGSGIPTTKQTCVDNDPACDFDPTPGVCRLHLWACLAGADERIACLADSAAAVTLVKPSTKQTGPAAAARQALLDAFGRFPLPAGPGEVCSKRIDLALPAGRAKLGVKTETMSTNGRRDRDSLKLICAPAGTVLKTR